MTRYDDEHAEAVEMIEALDLEVDDDRYPWTFYDDDPSVAWGIEPRVDGDPDASFHGRLAAILRRAGWKPCYHDRGAFHYPVKVHPAVRAFWAEADALLPNRDHHRYDRIADELHDSELWGWWRDDPTETFADRLRSGVYACGRSGGYVQVREPHYADVPAMIRFGEHAAASVEWYQSEDYARELAREAAREYTDRELRDLASPRAERVEA